MINISSPNNDKIKSVVKLHSKKERDLNNLFIVEGEEIVREAIRNKVVDQLFTTVEDYNDDEAFLVPEHVMKKMSQLSNPTTFLAVCNKIEAKEISSNKVLVLEELQDPGNVGTLIRTASCFGINDIIITPGCADIYNSKTLRATMGSLFNTNVIFMDVAEAISLLKEKDYQLVATALDNDAKDISNIKFDNKVAIFFGNEGKGLSNSCLEQCNTKVIIPIKNNDSLNVSVAAGIVMYEATKNATE